MKFRFTYHGQYRMFTEREISSDDVKTVIRHPDFEQRLSDGKIIATKSFSGKKLRVVYTIRGSEYIIITTFPL